MLDKSSIVIPIEVMSEDESELARELQICNACRYCEGFCAVFPAMTRRLDFSKADVNYLANLCHNCGACYHACQYAPPHEFMVNIPQAMARVRLETYTQYAWPKKLGALYQRNGLFVSLTLAFSLLIFSLAAHVQTSNQMTSHLEGNFYAVFPHSVLAIIFGVIFGFVLISLGIGVRRFWKDISTDRATTEAVIEASTNALTLKYLDGGHGEGCNESDDAFTLMRRRFHHFTFYGFMLCFAATSVATMYHYVLKWDAPYPVLSLPVLLGIAGGIGLLIGPAGLLWLNLRRHDQHGDVRQRPMDWVFITLLFLSGFTGLALLIWRDSPAMVNLLAIHLGVISALFISLPYGKFAHGIFRCAALLKSSIERRQASNLNLGSD
ncbi:tricarballylate utilization 4Fe-4S protein TcuB [Polynucleobacter sphagniphilus]|uniref:tricarballylate utilization 4Fe-4S protein TcuB n=1 Tax=Polynucleobacter sphagniphilus TaxID=1743169 RepID=UPI0022B8987A|nr:tricarballylate utilization 4Fe-4S protein TcuB [Polynucleobacter sphagniphilus]